MISLKSSILTSCFPAIVKKRLLSYKSCLDGEIVSMQIFADSPVEVPGEHKNRIFNAEFHAEEVRFMASDDLPSHQVSRGRNFALFMICSDKEEQATLFAKLTEGGKVTFPLENGFGMLTDKFGIQWMLAGE